MQPQMAQCGAGTFLGESFYSFTKRGDGDLITNATLKDMSQERQVMALPRFRGEQDG
jgi:hypothetical protein